MLERDVKKSLKEYLNKIGAYQFWPVPMGYGKKTVDVLFCFKGKFFAVEVKRPAVKKVTTFQGLVLDEIAVAGGFVCMENDPALPAVLRMLQQAF